MNQGSVLSVKLTGTSSLFLPANSQRVGIVLTSDTAASYTVSNQNPAVINVGVSMRPNNVPLVLTERDVGSWIKGDLWAVGSATINVLGILEITCPCKQPLPSP